jgi:hypothetical protein
MRTSGGYLLMNLSALILFSELFSIIRVRLEAERLAVAIIEFKSLRGGRYYVS